VREFEHLGRRKFEVEHVPESALVLQKSSSRDPSQESMVAMMLQAAHGDSIRMENTIRRFSIPLTSVKDFAKQRLQRASGVDTLGSEVGSITSTNAERR